MACHSCWTFMSHCWWIWSLGTVVIVTTIPTRPNFAPSTWAICLFLQKHTVAEVVSISLLKHNAGHKIKCQIKCCAAGQSEASAVDAHSVALFLFAQLYIRQATRPEAMDVWPTQSAGLVADSLSPFGGAHSTHGMLPVSGGAASPSSQNFFNAFNSPSTSGSAGPPSPLGVDFHPRVAGHLHAASSSFGSPSPHAHNPAPLSHSSLSTLPSLSTAGSHNSDTALPHSPARSNSSNSSAGEIWPFVIKCLLTEVWVGLSSGLQSSINKNRRHALSQLATSLIRVISPLKTMWSLAWKECFEAIGLSNLRLPPVLLGSNSKLLVCSSESVGIPTVAQLQASQRLQIGLFLHFCSLQSSTCQKQLKHSNQTARSHVTKLTGTGVLQTTCTSTTNGRLWDYVMTSWLLYAQL